MGTHLRNTVLLGIVLPALAYLTVHFTVFNGVPAPTPSPIDVLGIDPSAIDPDTLSARAAERMGVRSRQPATELVAIIITASWCKANGVEGFHESVAKIPQLLEAHIANRHDVLKRVIGIAIDPDVRTGVDHLLDLAQFDEIISGGDWLNTATEKYLWGTFALGGNIPQVAILQRTVTWTPYSVALEGDQILKTISGPDEIMNWVAQGAPIDGFIEAGYLDNPL